MNEKKAREILSKMITVFQKYRANAKEAIGNGKLEQEVLATASPYIFGEKSPLTVMVAMDKSDYIEPQSFWNICFLIHRFIPEIVAAAGLMGLIIPEPKRSWLLDEKAWKEGGE